MTKFEEATNRRRKRLFIFLSLFAVTNMWAPSFEELRNMFEQDVAEVVADVENAFDGGAAAAPKKPSVPKKRAGLSAKVKAQQAAMAVMKKKKPVPTPKGGVPLSKRAVAAACPVCMNHIRHGDLAQLSEKQEDGGLRKCGHAFCRGCLSSWMKSEHSNRDCPLCRTVLTDIEHDLVNPPRSVQDLIDSGHVFTIDPATGHLNLAGQRLGSLEGLHNIPNIQTVAYLNLEDNLLKRVSKGAFTGLGNVQIVDLSHNRISEIEPGAFTGLGNLFDLLLQHNGLETLQAGTFAGLDNLENVTLSHNHISEIEPGAFTGLNNLQGLELQHNRLETLQAGTFAGLGRLKQLYLEDNQLPTIAPNTFTGLGQLQRLHLDDNQIAELQPESFAGLGRNLRYLYLENNQLTVLNPVVFNHLHALSLLYLQNNPLPAGAKRRYKLQLMGKPQAALSIQ